jgi:hypothetical protein
MCGKENAYARKLGRQKSPSASHNRPHQILSLISQRPLARAQVRTTLHTVWLIVAHISPVFSSDGYGPSM